MARYALKRVLLLIPTLILVTFIVFMLMRIIPGDAVDYLVQVLQSSSGGKTIDREAVEVMLGLDKPLLTQYFIWLNDLLHGDLGDSFFMTGTVSSIISYEMPATLELVILTFLLTTVISIPLGLLCAARQDTITDNVIRVISVIMMSVPVFWIATLILVYPAVWWGYAPPMTYVSFFEAPIQNLRMFFIPALLGAITSAGGQLRNVRTLTLEVMRQDYIRTAWSKGIKERMILLKHAFRNTMIPVITMLGGSIGYLLGGSVILETMFNIPGIGQQLTTSLGMRDYPMVQGCILLISVIAMVINLIVDLLYKAVDPRVEIE
ncbi:MAG: ABC transporter permease [Oscillospiraceae bacterium]|nr:ABC transporter permease [Oscillospiraceae bacterium]